MPRLKPPGKKEQYHRMKYYAVLDTNVLVSAMLKSGSVFIAELLYQDKKKKKFWTMNYSPEYWSDREYQCLLA